MKEENYSIVAGFLPGTRGQLYTVHYIPSILSEKAECIVVSSAFAEEMNRCRYMCTMFAQGIASQGVGFFSYDTYGTGDSEGDFDELEWGQAGADLLTVCKYVLEQGYTRISILGIRMGALQALQVAKLIPNLHRMLFWQPVVNGNTALTQLLRLKIAGTINRDEESSSSEDFESMAESGKHIEVAGYSLSPNLFKGMKSAKMEDYLDFTHVKIVWFTTIASEKRKPPRAEILLMDKWRAEGATIDNFSIVGPPYWQVHERTLAPALVAATVQCVVGLDSL